MTGTPKMHTTPSPYICHTLENWLLLNYILPDSEDHLRYVFAALGTKSLEMHAIMDANWQQRGTEGDQGQSFCLPQLYPTGNDTQHQYPCAPWRIGRYCGQAGRGPPRSHCMHQDPDGPMQDDQWWASWAWTMLPYCPCIPPWGKAPRKTYGQAIQDTLQQAGWQFCEPLHSSKPVDTIHQDKGQTAHTSHSSRGYTPSAPSKDCPNCTQQHPAGRANCPACDSHCSKCNKMGHWGPKCHGGKPLQPRNTPPPGSQQRKSRCPPRNHNHCQGQKNKTDTIDVREDHSPQDEIALQHIQTKTTVWNTHPKEIMVRDVHAPQCNEAFTTIQLPASASRKGTASLHIKVVWRCRMVGPMLTPWQLRFSLYSGVVVTEGKCSLVTSLL